MVVISLPHASLLHPVALRRPLGPHQSSFISAKRTRGGNPTLPAANVLSGVSPVHRIPQPTPNQKPRLEQVQPRPRCCCTFTKRGFSIRSHLVTPPRAETPLIESAAKPPPPAANVLNGVSGLRRATGRCLTQKPRLAPVKPCGAGGWRLVWIAKPQPGSSAGAGVGDQPN